MSNLIDTLSGLSKDLESGRLVEVIAEVAQLILAEIDEVHEGDLLKLTDSERELRQKEMEKYPVHASVFLNGNPVGFTSDPAPAPRVAQSFTPYYDARPKCCGPGEACSSSTCTGTPVSSGDRLWEGLQEPKVDIEADFGFGLDACDVNHSGTTGTTVFPSVGLYEMISKLGQHQKDGLIESLGEGRWVKLDTLKKAIEKIENPGPRFNQDPLRAE